MNRSWENDATDGWPDGLAVIQHEERNFTKYWDITEI